MADKKTSLAPTPNDIPQPSPAVCPPSDEHAPLALIAPDDSAVNELTAADEPIASSQHVPVMGAEVLAWLAPGPAQTLVDATLGGGGHSRLLAELLGPAGTLIAIDRDGTAVARARQQAWPCRLIAIQASYAELGTILAELEIRGVQGIVMDLGLSSDQLADASRGFSFRVDGPLDLRFNPDRGEPASALIADLPEKALADLIYQYGEERFSRRIARRIVAQRQRTPIETTAQLAQIVRSCFPPRRTSYRHRPALDPATRTFQAIRIAVNEELQHLEQALNEYPKYLLPHGRLAVISFHSLEDRLVKQAFRTDPRWQVLTRKPLIPTESEIRGNPRSRSAKLRVAARAELTD